MIPSIQDLLDVLLGRLITEKPNDRSELDRRYAILITDVEKVVAYYQTYVGKNG